MSASIRVAKLAEVREGFVTLIKAAGKPVALTRFGEEVFAFDGMCTHAKYMFGTSRLTQGCQIECPVHGALFNARTGAVEKGPAETALPCIAARVEGEDVIIEADWPQQT
jgi:nitrite reductase/ring-hydroxylating ferredoxin subunit